MATIFWKTAVPFGTCRSRYKARRAAAIAARQREKRLVRRIGYLLGQEDGVTLSEKMRCAFPGGQRCPQCGLPGPGGLTACSFCQATDQSETES
ncbi:hypothetical protein [Pseudomonas cerasi]